MGGVFSVTYMCSRFVTMKSCLEKRLNGGRGLFWLPGSRCEIMVSWLCCIWITVRNNNYDGKVMHQMKRGLPQHSHETGRENETGTQDRASNTKTCSQRLPLQLDLPSMFLSLPSFIHWQSIDIHWQFNSDKVRALKIHSLPQILLVRHILLSKPSIKVHCIAIL